MSKNPVAFNMTVLTISGIIAKSVDFSFRAYYSKALGAEGMGIFSLIMSAFGIIMSLSSAGMGVAVSRLVSLNEEQGRPSSEVVRTAMFIVFSVGAVCVSGVFFFAEFIAENFLRDIRCVPGLLCMAPASIFMGISYCLKGYFYGIRQVIIPASSEFVEQAVKIFSISFFLNKGLYMGVEYGCAGVFLGLMTGELCSCLYLLIWYKIKEKSGDCEKSPLKKILQMTVPMTFSAVGNSFFRMVEDVWIIRGFLRFGEKNATGTYGLIHGMAMPLLVFPLNLISSFMALLVPEISRAEEGGRLKGTVYRVRELGVFLGFLVFTVFFVFSKELSLAVFGTAAASVYIKPLCVLCPVMIIDSLSTGMLGGLGEQKSLLIYSIMDTALRLGLVYFLLPYMGNFAIILMIFLSNLMTCFLTSKKIRKKSGAFFRLKDVAIPAVCSVFIVGISKFFISPETEGIYLVFCIVCVAIIYSGMYVFFGISYPKRSLKRLKRASTKELPK